MDEVACSDEVPLEGDGGLQDLRLRNTHLQVVVRHPQESLTLPGVGGGSIIDATPHGWRDRVTEWMPLVGGGALDVEAFEPLDDGVRVHGTVVPLPGRDAPGAGTAARITWRLDPDAPVIHLEGADGLWMHARGEVERVRDQLVGPALTAIHDGAVAEDPGGPVVLEGVSRLVVDRSSRVWSWLGDTETLDVETPPHAQVLLADDAGVYGLVQAPSDGRLQAEVRPGTRVRLRSARGSDPWQDAGTVERLVAPEPAHLTLAPRWRDLRPRPLALTWVDADGDRGSARLDPSGGTAAIPAGPVAVTVQAGAATAPRTLDLDLAPGSHARRSVLLDGIAVPDAVALALPWPGARSRTFRGTSEQSAEQAALAGFEAVVLTAEDEVAPAVDDTALGLRVESGSLIRGEDWSIVAWPWSASRRFAGHGALDPRRYSPEEALTAAWRGPSTDRFTAVDLGWLDRVAPVVGPAPLPDAVRLEAPDPQDPGAAWAPWWRWLDASIPVAPLGPVTWVDVPDPDRLAMVDVERGLVEGALCAGTGPWIDLQRVPPEEGPEPWPADLARLQVEVRGAVDEVAILAGGEVLDRSSAATPRDVLVDRAHRWVIAAAWSADGSTWVVSAPVLLEPGP